MKTTRKITTLLLLISMIISVGDASAAAYKQRFWDVSKDHWAFEYIADLTTRNVISGYEDGSFKPESTVTRAEWAKMMCTAANLAVYDNTVYFRDTENHWANRYINAAKDYITSYNSGTFRPDQAIVREDVTRSLVTLRGYDTSNVDYAYIAEFKDFDSISNYMKAYVAVAVEKGLITGFDDNTFRGQATLTRAEAATLLYRAFQKGDASKTDAVPDTPYEKPVVSDNSEESVNNTFLPDNISNIPEIKVEITDNDTINLEKDNTETSHEVNLIENVDASANDQFSTDGKDTIYYISDNKIYSKNILTEEMMCMGDISEIEVNSDSSYKTDFQVYSLCYDQYTGGVLLFGHYNTVNSAVDKASEYLYSITKSGIEIVSTNIPEEIGFIVKTLKNGDIVSEKAVWDRDTFDFKYNHIHYIESDFGRAAWGYTYDLVETSDSLSYVGIYELDADTAWGRTSVYVTEYDYKESETVWELSGDAFGISTEYVASINNGYLNVYNRYGKLLSSTEVPSSSEVLSKICIVGNHMIYYDINKSQLVILEI